MASHHRVLMVGEEGVILYAPVEKGIGRRASIPWTAKDFRRQMAAALRHRHDPVVVLFNESDHTYRKEENLLPAQKRERMEKFFPQARTRAALELPHDDKKLRNYLFVALPDSERYTRLGGALSETEIAGCAVLPVESTSLVAKLSKKVFGSKGKKSRWAILAGQHETGGLRMVCIRDGVLALTRIIPLDDRDRGAWAKTSAHELQVTMDYLRRFGYEDEHGMDIMMICDKGEKKLFGQKSVRGARLKCLTLQEALGHLGYKVSGQDGSHFADALYAAWAEHSEIKLLLPVEAIERS